MSSEIVMGCWGGGIGDNMQITPIFKHFRNSTIEIVNNEQGYRAAEIYKGMATIVMKDNPIRQEKSFEIYGNPNKHNAFENGAQNYLNIFSITDVTPIPWIVLTTEELLWARSFLSLFKNPLGFCCTNSNFKNPSGIDYYKQFPFHMWKEILEVYQKRYDILQFASISDEIIGYPGVIPIYGLTLRQAASCFKIIGRYLGIDTGLYHLALAAGAKVKTLVPTFGFAPNYYFPNWSYTPEMFGGECRAQYYLFEDYKRLMVENEY